MDTKFSSAIHILIMISESKENLNSDVLAKSVGTNSSYIRRILILLKEKNIIERAKGKYGYHLTDDPANISLFEIFIAVNHQSPNLFDIHQNANDKCIVGKHIFETLNSIFNDIDNQFIQLLKEKTLKDCIDEMKSLINADEYNAISKGHFDYENI